MELRRALILALASGSFAAGARDTHAQPRAPAPATARATTGCPVMSAPASGAIEGSLYLPAARQPPMIVVAISTTVAGCAYYLETRPSADRYQLRGLPDGSYHVVAYAAPRGGPERVGGYTDRVTCMNQCGIRGHCCDAARGVLHEVAVRNGRATRHVAISDWTPARRASAAALPARPAGVPAPPPGG